MAAGMALIGTRTWLFSALTCIADARKTDNQGWNSIWMTMDSRISLPNPCSG
jgi:hypothetical protein